MPIIRRNLLPPRAGAMLAAAALRVRRSPRRRHDSVQRDTRHHREHRRRAGRPRPIRTHVGLAGTVSDARLVPRCQVRHLGSLGPPMRARTGRLVRAEHVRRGLRADTGATSRTSGHPSKVGFKDVIHRWQAENWDPEKLLALYKRAGAQYFVALANHHDNFDLWDSKYQPWNSVRVGPKKDLIAGWAAGRAQARAALRRQRPRVARLVLVRGRPGRGRERPAGGRALRRQAHRGRRQGTVVGRPRSAGPLRAAPRAEPGFRRPALDSCTLDLGQRRNDARRRLLSELLQPHRSTSSTSTSPTWSTSTTPRCRSGRSATPA